MARPKLSEMTLREKIGQTAMPGPSTIRDGVVRHGGYDKYFNEFPYNGMYLDRSAIDKDGNKFESPKAISETLAHASNNIKIPLFVSCDAEFGAIAISDSLHEISTNLSVGAAKDKELAKERCYMWARELKTLGVNWPFGPMGNMISSFFGSSANRSIASSDYADVVAELYPYMIQGVQKAGMAANAKHFPGGIGGSYRDGHFSATGSAKDRVNFDKEAYLKKWNEKYRPIWKGAIDAGVESVMMAHGAMKAIDDSITRGTNIRPASASKKVLNFLREDLGFKGVAITDAVSMRSLSSSFDYDDIYIECFNAGNDIVLFVRDDYFEIMEKAVKDGRVSMERLDEAVERVLDMKEKMGLFDGEIKPAEALTEDENRYFEEVNYKIAKKALSIVRNENNVIPFNPEKVKKVTIIKLSPYAPFLDTLDTMAEAFEKRGIKTQILDHLESSQQLKELSKTEDAIIYACYMTRGKPQGFAFFDTPEDMCTLKYALTYGAEKSVVASFGHPSIYYNYFENCDTYINAYSPDTGTLRAFADGILGDFEMTGKAPITLYPDLI